MSVFTAFTPYRNIVDDITNASPAVVSCTQNHGYDDGLYIRLVMALDSNMYQLNNEVYLVTILSSDTFSIPVNTSSFLTFDSDTLQPSQIIPVGELSLTLSSAEQNNEASVQ